MRVPLPITEAGPVSRKTENRDSLSAEAERLTRTTAGRRFRSRLSKQERSVSSHSP